MVTPTIETLLFLSLRNIRLDLGCKNWRLYLQISNDNDDI